LAHICLQPVVLLGLAFLAARWESLSHVWRRIVIAGATLDLALGILLQFGAQSFLLDQWLAPQRSAAETFSSYSFIATRNLLAKQQGKWTFFGDHFVDHATLILALLGLLVLLAIVRARRGGGAASP
jgi:hypothetical protein